MANPLKIRFTDGTFIHVLSPVGNPVYNDSYPAYEQTYYQETIENGAICFGNMQAGHIEPPTFYPPVSKIDEAGNRWEFSTNEAGTTFSMAIYDPNDRLMWRTGPHAMSYDGISQGWIFYLIIGDTLDADGNYQIYLKKARSVIDRSASGREPDLDIRASYSNGNNAGNTMAADMASYTSANSKRVFLTNLVWGDNGFLSLVSVYYNRDASRTRSSESLIEDVTIAASIESLNPLKLNSETLYPDPDSNDPYADIDGESELGGDIIPIPNLPPESAVSTGILGLFSPTYAQMQALADFMWTDFGGQGTSVTDVLEEIVEAIKRSISNPLDYVVGLNLIPSQGLSIGASQTIRFGFVSSGVSMPRLTNQYFVVDCGSLSFDAICGDTFLDYAPYSKFSIYLPYIGFRDVDANDFVGHTIGVVYHGDTVTGGVTAYVTKDGSVMYQYSGCCALNIPLSSDSWGETISAATQIATALVGAAAPAAAGVSSVTGKGLGKAALATMKSTASAVASNPSLLSPQVQHSGAVSGSPGAMGVQTPFVIREAVRFHSTENFNSIAGYPSYYYRQLSMVKGYTTVVDVHLMGIPATKTEVEMIEDLLRGGVFL